MRAVLLLGLCWAGPAVAAQTYYVDRGTPGCSDAGPGTQAVPYCTITAAVAARHGADVTLLVAPGQYPEEVTVTAGGASNAPFVIQASGPGVVVDGADDLSASGSWVLYAGDVWKAAGVTWAPGQVFVDGVRFSASTAAQDLIPAGSFRYVAGEGLYLNLGGGSPGGHDVRVGRRSYGFQVNGAAWIAIQGFTVIRAESKGIYLRNAANHITVTGNTVTFSNGYGIQAVGCTAVTLGSNQVSDNRNHGIGLTAGTTGSTVEGNESFRNARVDTKAATGIYLSDAPGNVLQGNRLHDNEDSGVEIQNTSGTISRQNRAWNNGDHGFAILRATGTVHVGDVSWGNTANGFSIEGDATGTRMYDCIAAENGLGTGHYDLLVDAGSIIGFDSNDNVLWESNSQPLIQYGVSLYSSVSAYAAASGQDARSIQADPMFVAPASGDFRLREGSPAIDSGNSSLAEWPATDAAGRPRVDDPATANSGLGAVAYADRGALEMTPPQASLLVSPTSGGAPLHVTADASGSADADGAIASIRIEFGDGAAVDDPPAGIATHDYAAGTWTARAIVTDESGARDTAAVQISVSRGAPLVVAPAAVSGPEGAPLAVNVTVSGAGGAVIDTLRAVLSSLPAGNDAQFATDPDNAAGTLSWTPTFGDSGHYDVAFIAVANGLADTAVTTIEVVNVDRPPVVMAPPTMVGEENSLITVEITATDPDGDPIDTLIARLAGLPPGNNASFVADSENATGALTWTPATGDSGTYAVTFVAINQSADSAVTVITVTPPPQEVPTDEVHFTFMGQTAVTFDWRGTANLIHYGLTGAYGQSVIATPATPHPISSSEPYWEARLTGLQENTLYHYAIEDGPDHTFRTPPPRGSSGFTVCASADIGESRTFPEMGVMQTMMAGDAPAFCLFPGDLTYANSHGQWAVDRHFNDVMAWSQEAAYMPAWGNHEWDETTDDLRNYKGRFDLPHAQTSPGSPAVSCCGEDWYWFDYGNVRFIAYPEPWPGAFSDWAPKAAALMDEAEDDTSITFIVTFGHRPAYSSGHHPGMQSLKQYLDQLGASHPKYVLNLNGHSHNYERTYPQSGVVHVTVGNGGGNLEDDPTNGCLWKGGCPPPAYTAFRAYHYGYLRLTFTANEIHGEEICGPAGSDPEDVQCGLGTVMDDFRIPVDPQVNAVDGDSHLAFGLEQNHPNPFARQTTLHYTLPKTERASLGIYDLAGRLVRKLVDGERTAGSHREIWDGRSSTGEPLKAGVYFVRLRAGGSAVVRKVVLAR